MRPSGGGWRGSGGVRRFVPFFTCEGVKAWLRQVFSHLYHVLHMPQAHTQPIANPGASHNDMANAIRALAMDAVEAANSGHPGMPMGMADVATVLFTEFMSFDP